MDVGIALTSGNIGSTLARNARDVGSIPALGTIFPIFITPMTVGRFLSSKRLIVDSCILNIVIILLYTACVHPCSYQIVLYFY